MILNFKFLETQLLGFLLIISFMTLIWIISIIKRNAGIVDVFWGINFVLAAIFYYTNSEGVYLRKIIILLLVILWGFRLSIHIFIRNRGKGEDFRYAGFRKNAGPERYWWISFFQVFLLQGLLAALISAPLLGAMFYKSNAFPGIFDIAGLLFWIIGFLFESIGDYQLRKFKSDPSNRGKVLTTGLWRFTRHPNYFGDSAVWWGFALLSIGGGSWIPLFGAVLMTFLLLKISGVVLLEKSLSEEKPGYEDYRNKTSSFVPWFPKKMK